MDNKLNNMINEFIRDNDIKNEKEFDEKFQEFITKYNVGQIEYENTPLDDAYELLDKASYAKTEKQAIKLAKEAYKTCPDCLDAILFQVDLEESALKREKMLDEGLENEKKRLTRENYFEKDNIGMFYGIFETRPYIRGLYMKALNLASDGKIKQSKDVCKEILRLNENDNTGARYLLMAIYAFLEDEKELLDLYKKFHEDNLEVLFPLFALYYKKGDYKKAKKYLMDIDKINPEFVNFFKGELEPNDDVISGCYQKGHASEVFMYVNEYTFLLFSMPTIREFILQNINKSKK